MNHKSEEEDTIRLQVYLSHCGIASRRKSEEYISSGRVQVNGIIITQAGFKVAESDDIRFDGKPVKPEQNKWYIALNKPPGYICSQADKEGRLLAVDLLKPYFNERLYNVGRLDFLSEGLIFFSNDGGFTAIVSHPSSEIEKEYRIELFDPITPSQLDSFAAGVKIDDVIYKIRNYRIINTRCVVLSLIEGKNREIRRLMEHAGIKIRRLIRVKIGPVLLEGIAQGSYRHLTPQEIQWFYGRKRK